MKESDQKLGPDGDDDLADTQPTAGPADVRVEWVGKGDVEVLDEEDHGFNIEDLRAGGLPERRIGFFSRPGAFDEFPIVDDRELEENLKSGRASGKSGVDDTVFYFEGVHETRVRLSFAEIMDLLPKIRISDVEGRRRMSRRMLGFLNPARSAVSGEKLPTRSRREQDGFAEARKISELGRDVDADAGFVESDDSKILSTGEFGFADPRDIETDVLHCVKKIRKVLDSGEEN